MGVKIHLPEILTVMGVKPKSLPGSFPRMSSLLTFACLTSTISAKTLPADIKPSYQVMTGNGILGRFLPGEENFFQMDCSNCFPEGKLASMRIRDSSEKCGKHIVARTPVPRSTRTRVWQLSTLRVTTIPSK